MQAKIYKCHPDAIIPMAQTGEAVGFDLHAIEAFELSPGERKVVGTGLVVQPPLGYHTEIFLRSSMAYKYNIMLLNGVGLIDRDYCGPTDELKIMLYAAPVNFETSKFEKGARIAQLVFRKTERFELVEVDTAPAESRGGLGSTGK